MSNAHPLTKYREKAGISQAELGRKLGVGRNTVSRWESRVRVPEPKLWARIKAITNGALTIDDFAPVAEECNQ